MSKFKYLIIIKNIVITKSVLGTISKDQLKEFSIIEDGVPRTILPNILRYNGNAAIIIKGLRRCGKSTLLKQVIKSKVHNDFFYFNFDDDRLAGFKVEDFQTLMESQIELFGRKNNVFFDEIQNIHGWELFINRLLREGYHLFITGSNANLLSKELGTYLTGRHIDIELYPFSFTEFLKANKIAPLKGLYSTEEKVLLNKLFKDYFVKGGMPESVVFSNELILKHVVSDIIQKDIVNRYNIRKTGELKTVLNYLIANVANFITYRSIKNNFEIKSANTIQKYIEYAEETYLIFLVDRFEKKIKQFEKNPKKVYCMDNGIITKNSLTINEKKGAMLENLVAVQIKRIGEEFFYYKGKSGMEADFVIPNKKIAIQVCYELTDNNKKREIKGLLEAMNGTGATKGLILTYEQELEITEGNKKITIMPAWQWLLESEQNGIDKKADLFYSID